MVVSKTRRLPIHGEICVKVGDKVNYDTVVARAQVSGEPVPVNVAMLLGVESRDLPRYVTKKEGERVTKGEVLAAYNSVFGLIKKHVTSPLEGTIELVSNLTGQIIIRGLPISIEVQAYLPGKVVNVIPREGAVVETNAAFIQGIFGIGGESHGKIRMAVDSPSKEMTEDNVTSEDKGAVLIGGSFVTLEALKKAIEIKTACIVAGGIRHKDIKSLLGEEIGVAITGQEEVGTTVIITEGFGKMNMSRRTFDMFKSFDGYLACVNGATQIRAGVLRPEIIIPYETKTELPGSDELASGMIPGTPVRIIRKPYFGAIGKVHNLPVELQKIKSESYARILQVELEDGNIVTVPRANVEIIEE
jgi:hypothetical protein